jgi:hypothetical protein
MTVSKNIDTFQMSIILLSLLGCKGKARSADWMASPTDKTTAEAIFQYLNYEFSEIRLDTRNYIPMSFTQTAENAPKNAPHLS